MATPNPFILAEAEESVDTSTSSDILTLARYRKSKVKRKEKCNLSTERDYSGISQIQICRRASRKTKKLTQDHQLLQSSVLKYTLMIPMTIETTFSLLIFD